ncbi:hypothetical protein EON80_18130 [bacterium]|nr:MAG: hypothetical protein EON80_18130 [bacterium]
MADMTPQGTQKYSVESGYESADANIKAVVSGLGIILASTLVAMAAMFGMFNYLNRQQQEIADKVPPTLAKRIVPPEPRLLPLPYSDTFAEAKKLGADSPDVLPWDKRDNEIVTQYDESNGYAKYKGEGGAEAIRIPVSRAIELEAGTAQGTVEQEKAPAAIMTWQKEHPRLVAGETKGTMNLVPGTKITEPSTFDLRVKWESQDEKFNAESSGGLSLKAGEISR